MKFNFHLWHMFLLMAVVGCGLWAWARTGIGGLVLVGAWGCAAASELVRDQQQHAIEMPVTPPKPGRSIRILDSGLLALLGYWVVFHFANR